MRTLSSIRILVVVLCSTGCAITNYPTITDTRGDYSGVIRTMHKAYIVPITQMAYVFSDGSDEIFTMVYQNHYADRTLYSFNNFDPTGSTIFLDQTYCDWGYEGCAVMTCDDPHQDWLDDPFDYRIDFGCSGARSIEGFSNLQSRIGECGDSSLYDFQNLAAEFAELPTASFRGETAYVVPVSAANTSITLTNRDGISTTMPLYGQFTAILDSELRSIVPMTPNMKLQLAWLAHHVAATGSVQTVEITYGSLSASAEVGFIAENLAYNQSRF